MAERTVMEFTITIDRPPAAVFDYVVDVSKHSEWSPSPFRVEGSAGPVKVGDTFSSIGVMPGDKKHRNEVTVRECSPPDRLVLDCTDRDKHFLNTFRFEAVGNGTKLTRAVEAPQADLPAVGGVPVDQDGVHQPRGQQGTGDAEGQPREGLSPRWYGAAPDGQVRTATNTRPAPPGHPPDRRRGEYTNPMHSRAC